MAHGSLSDSRMFLQDGDRFIFPFLGTLQSIEIPTEGTDQNYVDRWLEKQKKVIEERCSMASLGKKLVAAITSAEESSTEVAQGKH